MTTNSSQIGPVPGSRGAQAPDLARDSAEAVRPILQALARVIATDRRAVVLASQKGEILLANLSAQRLNMTQGTLTSRFDWPDLCTRAQRAGSVEAVWQDNGSEFDGEMVHVPLGPAQGFLLRFSERDQESTWLRNRARSATLLRVAHDLRTPIQALLAAADPLIQRQQKEQQDQLGNDMKRAAELALTQISNVLSVIRGEQSLKGGQPDEDFRIVDEVENLVAMVQPIAVARASEVTLTVDAPKDLTLRGPLRFVRALCQNLIDNSVNHGGGHVDLVLSCAPLSPALAVDEAEGNLWRVELILKDEGGGLPPAQRKRLAEALGLPVEDSRQQVSVDPRRPSAGLNVLAHALRQLGGKLTIEDRGRDGAALPAGHDDRVIGTIFTVAFSLPKAMAQAEKSPAEGPARDPDALAGRAILLVEDSPASRDWLAFVLQNSGAEVFAVGSAPEALALLSRHNYASRIDLVLTDVTLPRISGIDLAARLRAGDPAAAARWSGHVVGLTAHADDRIRAACLAAGMTHVLEKPIKPQALTQCLARVLEGKPLKAGAGAAAPAADVALNPAVAEDLAKQLGPERTRAFMHRALSEARSVLGDLLAEGIGPDTGRRLHAATGASGLTGLQLVEKHLRAIELSVKDTGGVPAHLCDALADVLDHTHRMIEEFRS